MVQNLPTHGFKWENGEDFTREKIDELVKKDKKGYLLEVDVKYPKELHENHNELPFFVEKMKIKRVERYVIHIKALDQALKRFTAFWKEDRKYQKSQGYEVSDKQ